jgi:uncharacterized membrane protein YqjE
MVRPFSPSSRIGSIRLDMLRGLVPLVGTAFGLAGWYVTSLTVRCVTTIPRAAQDALAAALAIALVIGVIAGIWGVLRGPR